MGQSNSAIIANLGWNRSFRFLRDRAQLHIESVHDTLSCCCIILTSGNGLMLLRFLSRFEVAFTVDDAKEEFALEVGLMLSVQQTLLVGVGKHAFIEVRVSQVSVATAAAASTVHPEDVASLLLEERALRWCHHKLLKHIDVELVSNKLDDVKASLNPLLAVHVVFDRAVLGPHTTEELVSSQGSTVGDVETLQTLVGFLKYSHISLAYRNRGILVLETVSKVRIGGMLSFIMMFRNVNWIVVGLALLIVSRVVLEVVVEYSARFGGWQENSKDEFNENFKDSSKTTNVTKIVEDRVDLTLVVLSGFRAHHHKCETEISFIWVVVCDFRLLKFVHIHELELSFAELRIKRVPAVHKDSLHRRQLNRSLDISIKISKRVH